MTDPTKAVAVRDVPAELREASTTKILWVSQGGKELSKPHQIALAYVARKLRLNLALGEVMLVDTKAYITLQGYQTIAQRHPEFAGMQVRPLNAQERTDAKIAEDEHAWVAEIHRRDWVIPTLSIGTACLRDIKNDKIKPYVRELAQARAMRRGLKATFGYEPNVDEEEGIDLADVDVDPDSGEILEGVVTELPEAKPAVEPKAASVKPDWPKFWAQVKRWGATDDDVHAALRLESVTEWQGSLAEAADVVWLYLEQKPKNGSNGGSPPPDRLALLARCRQIKDNADALGLNAREVSDRWDLTALQRWFDETAPKVRAAEERESKRAASNPQGGLELELHDSI